MAGYLCKRVAEHGGVFERDGSYYRHCLAANCIGGVGEAAQTALDDGIFAPFAEEIQKCRCRLPFKRRGLILHFIGGGVDFAQVLFRKPGRAFAVHPVLFFKAEYFGRGERTRFKPRRKKNLSEVFTHRALAVGACDVNYFQSYRANRAYREGRACALTRSAYPKTAYLFIICALSEFCKIKKTP